MMLVRRACSRALRSYSGAGVVLPTSPFCPHMRLNSPQVSRWTSETDPRQQQRRNNVSSKVSAPPPEENERMQSLLRKQLHHFDDPYHMANHVDGELRRSRFTQALEFTRMASATANCIVAWNFLLRHQLKEQRLRAALKLFNEVTCRPAP